MNSNKEIRVCGGYIHISKSESYEKGNGYYLNSYDLNGIPVASDFVTCGDDIGDAIELLSEELTDLQDAREEDNS